MKTKILKRNMAPCLKTRTPVYNFLDAIFYLNNSFLQEVSNVLNWFTFGIYDLI